MSSITIRLRPKSHQSLRDIAQRTGESMQDALDKAIEDRRRKVYMDGLRADYAAMRSDRRASAEFDAENALWDRTNADGLEEL